MLNKRRGQSTVEYIVLVSAVIAVAVAFFLSPQSGFQNTLNKTYSDATTKIDDRTREVTNMQNGIIGDGQSSKSLDIPATLVGTCPCGVNPNEPYGCNQC